MLFGVANVICQWPTQPNSQSTLIVVVVVVVTRAVHAQLARRRLLRLHKWEKKLLRSWSSHRRCYNALAAHSKISSTKLWNGKRKGKTLFMDEFSINLSHFTLRPFHISALSLHSLCENHVDEAQRFILRVMRPCCSKHATDKWRLVQTIFSCTCNQRRERDTSKNMKIN